MKREIIKEIVQYIASVRRCGRWDELGGRQPRRGARWDRLDDAVLLALRHKSTAPIIIERVTFQQVHVSIDEGNINGVGTLVENGRRVLVATVVPSGDSHEVVVDPAEKFTLRAKRATPVRP